jgi:multiple antibiotic resistance protein
MIPTVISVLINIALAGLLFSGATVIMRFLGQAGTKALSKVMALLLAAIAVMLIRKGLQQFIA